MFRSFTYKSVLSLPSELHKLLTAQAVTELLASLHHDQGAYWFEERHLSGIAKFLKKEADEERLHYRSILDYLSLRGSPVQLHLPETSGLSWQSEVEVFESALQLEENNYVALAKLSELAKSHNDYDTLRFSMKLLEDQVQAVDKWEGLLVKVKTFASFPGLIWHLDEMI
mmetsp:Transcript_34639/g.60917  ORF Transcript_34639/g.60917 Transcript_34639/m.60917 type:complete len:170 (+) Transcript_34639:1349-1858(+)